jgi:four helix bundle protein
MAFTIDSIRYALFAKGRRKADMAAVKFRFEDLEIWRMAIELSDLLFDVADELETKKLFRFAEQLRGAGLSMANNIAEGAGSTSDREFIQFLNVARRSTFENANMLITFDRRKLISRTLRDQLLERLDHLSRKLTSFQRTLRART